jgi:serine/threonine-protein kinase ULK/ATG1
LLYLVDKDEYIKSALIAEIAILKTLKSKNIVGFLDVMESANYYYLVQEFCDSGDVRGLIKKRGPIPEAEAIDILKQVCYGFIEMLKEGVVHR